MTQNISKKKYVKPSMEVYEMKHQTLLLQCSSVPTGPSWPGGVPW